MSLNIPPASGVTPAGAAVQLRKIIKGWMLKNEAPQVVTTDAFPLQLVNDAWIRYRGNAEAHLAYIVLTCNELVQISTRRRPSETRKYVESLRQELQRMLSAERKEAALMRATARDYAHKQENTLEAHVGSGINPTELRKAYALVQVIPTIESAPSGKTDTTLRAITAILKAHHGIIEGGPEKLPQMLSHLLVEMMTDEEKKQNAQAAEIWTPLKVPGGAVVSVAHQLEAELQPDPVGPFFIQGGTKAPPYWNVTGYVFQKQNWEDPIFEKHGHVDDGEAPQVNWKLWNYGDCPWPVAALAFKHMAVKYNGPYVLRTETETLAARPESYQPILWFLDKYPQTKVPFWSPKIKSHLYTEEQNGETENETVGTPTSGFIAD